MSTTGRQPGTGAVERSSWEWQYGIESKTPDLGVRVNWDETQYPKSRNDMELQVRGIEEAFKRAGSETVSSVRLLRRKRWTKTITTYEAPERMP